MEWQVHRSLVEIIDLSRQKPVMIFKYSTRCGISSDALRRLKRSWKPGDNETAHTVSVNVLEEKKLSDEIAMHFNVTHESPQVLVIKNGRMAYSASHYDIQYEEVTRNF